MYNAEPMWTGGNKGGNAPEAKAHELERALFEDIGAHSLKIEG